MTKNPNLKNFFFGGGGGGGGGEGNFGGGGGGLRGIHSKVHLNIDPKQLSCTPTIRILAQAVLKIDKIFQMS